MLTIISHFYNSWPRVAKVLEAYRSAQEIGKGQIEFVLIDDHSHDECNIDLKDLNPGLRMFRILEDIPWNMSAARNIGVLESRTSSVLLHDIDHNFMAGDVVRLIEESKRIQQREKVYFKRAIVDNSGEMTNIKPHLNSFMMRRADFLSVGGYDELFSGAYGKEDVYFQWCCRKLGFSERESNITLINNDYKSITSVDRNTVRNTALIRYYMSMHQMRSQNNFLFNYEEVVR